MMASATINDSRSNLQPSIMATATYNNRLQRLLLSTSDDGCRNQNH